MMMMSLPAMPPRSHLVDDFGNRATGSLVGQGWSNVDASTNINWTVETDSGSLSGKRLLIDKTTSNATRRLKFDAAGTPGSVEVLARIKVTGTSGDEAIGQVNVRAVSGPGGYFSPLYVYVGSDFHNVSRITGEGTTDLLDDGAFDFNTTDWFWCRFRAIGSSLSVKHWASGSTEPSSFQLTATDSNVTTGAVALGAYLSTINQYADFFSVALDGATAPGPAG